VKPLPVPAWLQASQNSEAFTSSNGSTVVTPLAAPAWLTAQQNTPAKPDQGRSYIGSIVRKHFAGHGVFHGTVVEMKHGEGGEPDLFTVEYSDGDREDFERDELMSLISEGMNATTKVKVGTKVKNGQVIEVLNDGMHMIRWEDGSETKHTGSDTIKFSKDVSAGFNSKIQVGGDFQVSALPPFAGSTCTQKELEEEPSSVRIDIISFFNSKLRCSGAKWFSEHGRDDNLAYSSTRVRSSYLKQIGRKYVVREMVENDMLCERDGATAENMQRYQEITSAVVARPKAASSAAPVLKGVGGETVGIVPPPAWLMALGGTSGAGATAEPVAKRTKMDFQAR
jgi:hypothetical protein